uniref:Uncharacterized protein n=1 Tax=Diadegma fenestrale ichnovirus TaxID=1428464 RepID=A0A075VR24_9VIRU|nr:hypothetical protein A3.1 [Diadegma fenestrale ichnovirus]
MYIYSMISLVLTITLSPSIHIISKRPAERLFFMYCWEHSSPFVNHLCTWTLSTVGYQNIHHPFVHFDECHLARRQPIPRFRVQINVGLRSQPLKQFAIGTHDCQMYHSEARVIVRRVEVSSQLCQYRKNLNRLCSSVCLHCKVDAKIAVFIFLLQERGNWSLDVVTKPVEHWDRSSFGELVEDGFQCLRIFFEQFSYFTILHYSQIAQPIQSECRGKMKLKVIRLLYIYQLFII